MGAQARFAAVPIGVLILIASLTGCTRGYGSNYDSEPDSDAGYVAPSCSQLLTAAVNYARTGTGSIDSTLQTLSDNCADEYEIATDYLSNATDSEFRIDSCDKLLGYGIRTEAVSLLEEGGFCAFGGTAGGAASDWPEGGLGWDQARAHAGSVQRVCGPLMSARETADGTFLNVGQDYPSADRFTFIFWDIYLEPIESGATVCGAGEIYLYNGVAQIEMSDPASLEIWR